MGGVGWGGGGGGHVQWGFIAFFNSHKYVRVSQVPRRSHSPNVLQMCIICSSLNFSLSCFLQNIFSADWG